MWRGGTLHISNGGESLFTYDVEESLFTFGVEESE
jgi:hypothetical protein